VIRFTHTIRMDWVLPCIEPTGKRIEFAMVVVVYMKDDKIAVENLYWDNATILRQASLLPNPNLPVLGAERARQVLDPSAPHNQLLRCT
jgi:carboxymethylenebutenolidase